VGFVTAGVRELQHARVGDTITLVNRPAATPLPGFKEIKPQVFAGLYPVEASEYEALRDALEKLKLNDASLHYEPETSQALGFGFRCGFSASCTWISCRNGLKGNTKWRSSRPHHGGVRGAVAGRTVARIENPAKNAGSLENRRDSRADHRNDHFRAAGIRRSDHDLCMQKRGCRKNMQYHARQVMLTYEMPLNEVVMDFSTNSSPRAAVMPRSTRIQGVPRRRHGEARYPHHGDRVDALSLMVHRENSTYRGAIWFRECGS